MKRDNLIIKIAYAIDEVPAEISLCKLFWKFLTNLLFILPLLYIVTGMIYITAFFFAGSPATVEEDRELAFGRNGFPIVYYKKWPKICGHQVWPITVVIIAAIFSLIFYNLNFIVLHLKDHRYQLIFGLVIIALICLLIEHWNSDFVKFFKDYIKTFKTKACPIIKID